MFEREIERNIADFRQLGIPAFVPRECRAHMVDRMASTIIGARRAGKSFRAMQENIRYRLGPGKCQQPGMGRLLSRALENMVFLHLRRKWRRIHYYLTRKKRREVDFIAVGDDGRAELAVQVCMDIREEETLKRELEPIVVAADYFGIKENLIITYNREKEFHEKGIAVRALPAWRWLVENR